LRSSKRRISASSADVGAGGADAGVALEHAVGQAGEHLEGDADHRVEAADDVDV
jgi:hypothetical protein